MAGLITQAELTDQLAQAEMLLLREPFHEKARQFLWQAYWGLADLYYNHGDFDGHIRLLQSVVDVSNKAARAAGLYKKHLKRFISWEGTCGLGHLAQGLDIHVKGRALNVLPDRPVTILAHPDVVANKHLLRYFAPHFSVIDKPEAIQARVHLGGAHGYFGALENHFVVTEMADGRGLGYCEAAWEIQRKWERQNRPPVLELSDDDRERGYQALAKYGLKPSDWFAVLHVRESNNWDHAAGRNVALSDYFPAIATIAERGGWVARVGNSQMTPLPPFPNVIDLAHAERRDWLDVFCFGAARFMLGTQSGPAEVPPVFGVPTLLTNWQFGFRPGHATDTAIFKRYQAGGRVLTMREALEKKFAFIETPGMYAPGVEVLSNTPTEIRELVEEHLDAQPITLIQGERLAQFNAMQREVMSQHTHTPNGYCPVGRKWLEKVWIEEIEDRVLYGGGEGGEPVGLLNAGDYAS